MNYYQFHLGDYAVSTRGLSWDEHCAYRMLIDLYYAREEPISLDRQLVYRQTMARSKRQRAAIDLVLADYFTETPEGWVNERCERDLAAYRLKGERASQAGMASAAARRARAQQSDEAELPNERPMDDGHGLNTGSTDDEQPFNDRSTDVQPAPNSRSTPVQPTNNQKPITKRKNLTPLTPRARAAERALQAESAAGAEPDAQPAPGMQTAGMADPPEASRSRPRRTTDPAAWRGVMTEQPPDVPDDLWRDFCALRKARGAPVTARALAGVRREAGKAGATMPEALAFMVERGHQGFIVDAWMKQAQASGPPGRVGRGRSVMPTPASYSEGVQEDGRIF